MTTEYTKFVTLSEVANRLSKANFLAYLDKIIEINPEMSTERKNHIEAVKAEMIENGISKASITAKMNSAKMAIQRVIKRDDDLLATLSFQHSIYSQALK